jgi:hypothetical protein
MQGSVISHIKPEQSLETLAQLANLIIAEVKCEGHIPWKEA